MKVIGVIHATAKSIKPVTDAVNERYPSTTIVNFLNENLTVRTNQMSIVDEKALRMFARLVFEAQETELDGILVACSIFCPHVPLLRNFGETPIMAIDMPMITKAAELGNKIGILHTNNSAGTITEGQILSYAKSKGRKVETITHQCLDALQEIDAGNEQLHNERIADAVIKMKYQGCDTVVLCQISMANAANLVMDDDLLILTSLDEGLRAFFGD